MTTKFSEEEYFRLRQEGRRCQMHFGDSSKPCGKPAMYSYKGTDGQSYYACRRHYRQWFAPDEPTSFQRLIILGIYTAVGAAILLVVVALLKWSFIELFRR